MILLRILPKFDLVVLLHFFFSYDDFMYLSICSSLIVLVSDSSEKKYLFSAFPPFLGDVHSSVYIRSLFTSSI